MVTESLPGLAFGTLPSVSKTGCCRHNLNYLLGDSFLVHLKDVNHHATSSGQLSVANVALEVFGFLMRNQNFFVRKHTIAVPAEGLWRLSSSFATHGEHGTMLQGSTQKHLQLGAPPLRHTFCNMTQCARLIYRARLNRVKHCGSGLVETKGKLLYSGYSEMAVFFPSLK